MDFLNDLSPAEKQHVFLLSDYELLKQELNGLHVVAQSNIDRSILVTSHYADPLLQERSSKTGTKILPKQLASVGRTVGKAVGSHKEIFEMVMKKPHVVLADAAKSIRSKASFGTIRTYKFYTGDFLKTARKA